MNWGALLKSKTAGFGLLLVLVGIGKVLFPDALPWDSIIPILLGAMGVTGRDAISKIEQSGKCETRPKDQGGGA